MIVINWFQEKPDYLHRPPGYDKTNTSSVVKMLRHPDSNRDEFTRYCREGISPIIYIFTCTFAG